MSFTLKIWSATVGRFTSWLNDLGEQRLLRDSSNHPLISFRRETIMYYENGRSTAINSAFALGSDALDVVIYRETPLKWQDTGELLTPEESDKVYSRLPGLLASKNIRWAYSEMVHKRAKKA